MVQFGAGWYGIPSKLEQKSVFLVLNLLLAKEPLFTFHNLIAEL